MVNVNDYMITCETPENQAFVKAWHEQRKKWGHPYNAILYRYPITVLGSCCDQLYWFFNVVERAGTVNPEKIIATFEGDKYKGLTGVLEMRTCDHQAVKPMYAAEFEYPNPWVKDAASYGKPFVIPAQYCTPPLPEGLDRCEK